MAAEAPPAKRPKADRGARSAAEVSRSSCAAGVPPGGGGKAPGASAGVHPETQGQGSDGEDEYDHLVSGFQRRAPPHACGRSGAADPAEAAGLNDENALWEPLSDGDDWWSDVEEDGGEEAEETVAPAVASREEAGWVSLAASAELCAQVDACWRLPTAAVPAWLARCSAALSRLSGDPASLRRARLDLLSRVLGALQLGLWPSPVLLDFAAAAARAGYLPAVPLLRGLCNAISAHARDCGLAPPFEASPSVTPRSAAPTPPAPPTTAAPAAALPAASALAPSSFAGPFPARSAGHPGALIASVAAAPKFRSRLHSLLDLAAAVTLVAAAPQPPADESDRAGAGVVVAFLSLTCEIVTSTRGRQPCGGADAGLGCQDSQGRRPEGRQEGSSDRGQGRGKTGHQDVSGEGSRGVNEDWRGVNGFRNGQGSVEESTLRAGLAALQLACESPATLHALCLAQALCLSEWNRLQSAAVSLLAGGPPPALNGSPPPAVNGRSPPAVNGRSLPAVNGTPALLRLIASSAIAPQAGTEGGATEGGASGGEAVGGGCALSEEGLSGPFTAGGRPPFTADVSVPFTAGGGPPFTAGGRPPFTAGGGPPFTACGGAGFRLAVLSACAGCFAPAACAATGPDATWPPVEVLLRSGAWRGLWAAQSSHPQASPQPYPTPPFPTGADRLNGPAAVGAQGRGGCALHAGESGGAEVFFPCTSGLGCGLGCGFVATEAEAFGLFSAPVSQPPPRCPGPSLALWGARGADAVTDTIATRIRLLFTHAASQPRPPPLLLARVRALARQAGAEAMAGVLWQLAVSGQLGGCEPGNTGGEAGVHLGVALLCALDHSAAYLWPVGGGGRLPPPLASHSPPTAALPPSHPPAAAAYHLSAPDGRFADAVPSPFSAHPLAPPNVHPAHGSNSNGRRQMQPPEIATADQEATSPSRMVPHVTVVVGHSPLAGTRPSAPTAAAQTHSSEAFPPPPVGYTSSPPTPRVLLCLIRRVWARQLPATLTTQDAPRAALAAHLLFALLARACLRDTAARSQSHPPTPPAAARPAGHAPPAAARLLSALTAQLALLLDAALQPAPRAPRQPFQPTAVLAFCSLFTALAVRYTPDLLLAPAAAARRRLASALWRSGSPALGHVWLNLADPADARCAAGLVRGVT